MEEGREGEILIGSLLRCFIVLSPVTLQLTELIGTIVFFWDTPSPPSADVILATPLKEEGTDSPLSMYAS